MVQLHCHGLNLLDLQAPPGAMFPEHILIPESIASTPVVAVSLTRFRYLLDCRGRCKRICPRFGVCPTCLLAPPAGLVLGLQSTVRSVLTLGLAVILHKVMSSSLLCHAESRVRVCAVAGGGAHHAKPAQSAHAAPAHRHPDPHLLLRGEYQALVCFLGVISRRRCRSSVPHARASCSARFSFPVARQTPIGMVIGIVADQVITVGSQSLVNAFCVGSFLYIGASEVIIESFSRYITASNSLWS